MLLFNKIFGTDHGLFVGSCVIGTSIAAGASLAKRADRMLRNSFHIKASARQDGKTGSP
jgi:hypothetical protein